MDRYERSSFSPMQALGAARRARVHYNDTGLQ